MDAGLAWTIVGSVAGAVALPAGVVIGVLQLRQSRKDSDVVPAPVAAGGLSVARRPAAYDAVAAGLVVAGEIPQQPLGWQARHGLMAALEAPAPGSRGVVVRALTGMRGVGKTQLAAAYARSRLTADGSWLVSWIAADTPGTLLAGLAALAEALNLPAAPDAQGAGLAVRHWLEAGGTGCLLVLDNVTDVELVQPYVPVAGAARVIITSNQQSVAALGETVDVTVFTEAEGRAYLAERTGLADEGKAQELGDALGWLPLALAQAAAVIAGQRLGYGDYLERLHRVPVGGLLVPAAAGQYPRGMAAAVLLSLETATAGDGIGASAGVMRLVSVLSAAGVSRQLVRAAARAGALGASPDGCCLAPESADEALGRLASASLLTFTLDGSAVTAHRLVARVIREQLAAAGALAAVCQAAADLLQAQAGSLQETWHANRAAARDLTAQISALAERASACPGDERLTRAILSLRNRASWFLNELGDSADQAIAFAQDLLADYEHLLGPGHRDTLASRNRLANAYLAAGRAAEAIPLYERTIAACERTLGPDDSQTLSTRNNLAVAYLEAGRPAEAIDAHKATLAARQRTLAPGHLDTIGSRHNLAAAYLADGRAAEALPLLEQVIADFEATLGPDHPYTLESQGNLAEAYRIAGRTAEAIDLNQHTLDRSQRTLGLDHPETLARSHNLAVAYRDAGQITAAIDLHQRTLADRERTLGSDHPHVHESRNSLAAAYQDAGRTTEAITLYEFTLSGREHKLSPDHPDVVITQRNLAGARQAASRNQPPSRQALWTLGRRREGPRSPR
jgi:tetratricopeptide (TPR) repeat protein